MLVFAIKVILIFVTLVKPLEGSKEQHGFVSGKFRFVLAKLDEPRELRIVHSSSLDARLLNKCDKDGNEATRVASLQTQRFKSWVSWHASEVQRRCALYRQSIQKSKERRDVPARIRIVYTIQMKSRALVALKSDNSAIDIDRQLTVGTAPSALTLDVPFIGRYLSDEWIEYALKHDASYHHGNGTFQPYYCDPNKVLGGKIPFPTPDPQCRCPLEALLAFPRALTTMTFVGNGGTMRTLLFPVGGNEDGERTYVALLGDTFSLPPENSRKIDLTHVVGSSNVVSACKSSQWRSSIHYVLDFGGYAAQAFDVMQAVAGAGSKLGIDLAGGYIAQLGGEYSSILGVPARHLLDELQATAEQLSGMAPRTTFVQIEHPYHQRWTRHAHDLNSEMALLERSKVERRQVYADLVSSAAANQKQQVILLCNRQSSGRRLTGVNFASLKESLRKYASSHNYEFRIFSGGYGLYKQLSAVNVFDRVRAVVGAHGGCFANIGYMRAGTARIHRDRIGESHVPASLPVLVEFCTYKSPGSSKSYFYNGMTSALFSHFCIPETFPIEGSDEREVDTALVIDVLQAALAAPQEHHQHRPALASASKTLASQCEVVHPTSPPVFNVDSKCHSENDTALSLHKLLTVTVLTSRVPSWPSTQMIESAIESIRRQLPPPANRKVRVVVVVHRNTNFEKTPTDVRLVDQYVKNLRLVKSVHRVHEIRGGSGGVAMASMIEMCETPYGVFLEHDWLVCRPVDFAGIVREMELDRSINYVRISWGRIVVDKWTVELTQSRRSQFVPLVACATYSNHPHVYRRQNFVDNLLPKLKAQNGFGFIEGVLQKQLHHDYRDFGAERAHKLWNVYVYGAVNSVGYLHHMNGKKFEVNKSKRKCW
jgi:hypothetical protein